MRESVGVRTISLTCSRMRIRFENIYVAVQNPWSKSRAGSTPLCKTVIYGNQLSLNPIDTLSLYFENVNGLPTYKNGFKSDKVKRLRHVWSKLETDVMSLAETQINTSILPKKRFPACCSVPSSTGYFYIK